LKFIEFAQLLTNRTPEESRDLLHALRRLAIAHHDAAKSSDARAVLEDALSVGKDILRTGTHPCFMPTYRMMVRDAVMYVREADEVTMLTDMVGVFAKYCQNRAEVGMAFVEVAVKLMSQRVVTAGDAVSGPLRDNGVDMKPRSGEGQGPEEVDPVTTAASLQRPRLLHAAKQHLERARSVLDAAAVDPTDDRLTIVKVNTALCLAQLGQAREAVTLLKAVCTDPELSSPFAMFALAGVLSQPSSDVYDPEDAEEWVVEAQKAEQDMLAVDVPCPVLFAPIQ
jgi:hypothetical protein